MVVVVWYFGFGFVYRANHTTPCKSCWTAALGPRLDVLHKSCVQEKTRDKQTTFAVLEYDRLNEAPEKDSVSVVTEVSTTREGHVWCEASHLMIVYYQAFLFAKITA